jgi:hypothetical protein
MKAAHASGPAFAEEAHDCDIYLPPKADMCGALGHICFAPVEARCLPPLNCKDPLVGIGTDGRALLPNRNISALYWVFPFSLLEGLTGRCVGTA